MQTKPSLEQLKALIKEKTAKKPEAHRETETLAQHSEWCQGCLGCWPVEDEI